MDVRASVAVLVLLAVGLVAAASLSERAAKSPSAAQGLAADPVPIVRAPRLPDPPFRYELGHDLPAHFREGLAPRFDNTPPDNPVTDAGAALGRVLFYDTQLSANGTISCGSCHIQQHAFDDPSRFSRGFRGVLTDRHAMSLVNLRYHPRGRFFWDERGETLETMVLLPVENRIEMGQDVAALPDILGDETYYPQLFRQAFGDETITTDRISRALAQFLRSMVSYRSRYDEGRAAVAAVADDFPNFTRDENRGKALFLRNCAICHLPSQDAHFVMTEPANTGLDDGPETADGGVGDITLSSLQLGMFKAPSLRNAEVTAPYMHDGRFATLEAVIDHYSSGGLDHPNRDIRMQPLRFTASERAALIAFLTTLTDPEFLTDPRFSDPFQESSSPILQGVSP